MPQPQQADIFAVPLLDGHFGQGQVIEADDTPNGTALCALTARKGPAADALPLSLAEIVSIQLLSTNAITSVLWPILGFEQIPAVSRLIDMKHFKFFGWDDLTEQPPEITEAFLNACAGLYPWDGFPDPAFFDAMLLPKRTRPATARLASEMKG